MKIIIVVTLVAIISLVSALEHNDTTESVMGNPATSYYAILLPIMRELMRNSLSGNEKNLTGYSHTLPEKNNGAARK